MFRDLLGAIQSSLVLWAVFQCPSSYHKFSCVRIPLKIPNQDCSSHGCAIVRKLLRCSEGFTAGNWETCGITQQNSEPGIPTNGGRFDNHRSQKHSICGTPVQVCYLSSLHSCAEGCIYCSDFRCQDIYIYNNIFCTIYFYILYF